jgi:hypothetical protein
MEQSKTTVQEILAWWQAAHFKLNLDQQSKFMNHAFIPNICKLRPEVVKEVILLNKLNKLKDIYLVAAALQTAKYPSTNRPTTAPSKRVINILKPKFVPVSKKPNSTSRGRESFREHGMINPPPAERLEIDRTKLPKCSICEQPIVGTMCGCWD